MTDAAMTEPTAPGQQRSRLSRKWTIKVALISLGLLAFGLYGLYDATVGYPGRGSQASEFLEYQFLQQLINDHLEGRASIQDPVGALAELQTKEKAGPLSPVDRAEIEWLQQLELIKKLEPATASTVIPRTDFRPAQPDLDNVVKDLGQRKDALKKRWTTSAGTPRGASPLSFYDIPTQWLITLGGLGAGAWLMLVLVRAKGQVYQWNATEQRLTLPGGASVVPADIEEFDKRKWHKFYITLKVKGSHPQLGGKDITIDLMRHEPVEEWVLAMEKTAFPPSGKGTEPASDLAPVGG